MKAITTRLWGCVLHAEVFRLRSATWLDDVIVIVSKWRPSWIRHLGFLPGIVNRTQSNCISIELNRTQSNLIDGLSSIEFGNRTKSNSHKKNWRIKRNRTFDFRTLDFCKTGVKSDNKVLEARVYTSVKHVFLVAAQFPEKRLQIRCGLLALNA